MPDWRCCRHEYPGTAHGLLPGQRPAPLLEDIPAAGADERTKSKLLRDIYTFRLNRMAHKAGGYIGRDAVIAGIPSLPHGLHGIYISRYASIGKNCRIYQNVTIGEVNRKAPQIGNNCLIGAGAVIVGDVKIGDNVRIGAGAAVSRDIPPNCTVVPQPPRVLVRESL